MKCLDQTTKEPFTQGTLKAALELRAAFNVPFDEWTEVFAWKGWLVRLSS